MAIETLDQPSSVPAGEGCGAYPIPLNGITTAAFLGRAERGPTNEPVCIENFPEYCRYFGGHSADGAVSHAVQDFFLHGGGRAVIVRIANRAARARIDIPTDAETLRIQARYPGRHEVLRVSIDYERAEEDECVFNLVVQRLNGPGSGIVEDQELYPLISTRPSDPRFIGNVLKSSRLISLSGPPPRTRPLATPPDRPGSPVRFIGLTEPGDDGDELTDYDIIGSDRNGTGLFAFLRGPRCHLMAIPLPPGRELGWTAFLAAARFCEDQRALLIFDPPNSWQSVDAAVLGSRQLNHTSRNVMTYFPRVRPRGARERFADGMPACGAIAGMLARRDRRGLWGQHETSDFVLRSALIPVVDVASTEAKRLARYGINSFVCDSGGAMRLAGRVTLGIAGQGGGLHPTLDRRRLGLYIIRSIEDAAAAASQELDRNAAASRLRNQLARFFGDLHARRALPGRTADQAYYLHLSPDLRDGHPGVRFGFALAEPARFAEYLIELGGDQSGRLQRVGALEAEQLYS